MCDKNHTKSGNNLAEVCCLACPEYTAQTQRDRNGKGSSKSLLVSIIYLPSAQPNHSFCDNFNVVKFTQDPAHNMFRQQ